MVYTGISINSVLTVENYSKWYDAYILEGEQVVPLQEEARAKATIARLLEHDIRVIDDHVLDPDTLIILADILALELDLVSYEVALGRWSRIDERGRMPNSVEKAKTLIGYTQGPWFPSDLNDDYRSGWNHIRSQAVSWAPDGPDSYPTRKAAVVTWKRQTFVNCRLPAYVAGTLACANVILRRDQIPEAL